MQLDPSGCAALDVRHLYWMTAPSVNQFELWMCGTSTGCTATELQAHLLNIALIIPKLTNVSRII